VRSFAYGETVAPAQVDTLRDEECPICGADSDAFDGDRCEECGFVLPPSFVRDPDLEMARKLDLRGDQEPTIPEISPQEAAPGGPMPGVVSPDQVAEDGSVPGEEQDEDTVDPDQLPEDSEDPEAEEGAVDEQGNPVDPEAATGHVNQGGESFTPDPNDPEQPGEPEEPETVDPEALDENGEPLEAEDGTQEPEEVPGAGDGTEDDSGVVEGDVESLGDEEEAPGDEAGIVEGQQPTTVGEPPPPGTPGDESPDLVCPACGFEAPAARPTSTNMDDPMSPDASGDGMLAGDACPNCGQATLLPIGDVEEMQAEAPVEEGEAPEDDAGGAPEEEAEAPEEGQEEPEADDQDEEDDGKKKPPPFG